MPEQSVEYKVLVSEKGSNGARCNERGRRGWVGEQAGERAGGKHKTYPVWLLPSSL